MTEYQARLAAQDTYGVLVVIQALDAAGKDGTIRHVMSGVNPQGVRCTHSRCRLLRSSTTTTCGATPRTCPVAGRSASSTARTTKRSSWYACTPRTSSASGCPRAPAAETSGKRRYRDINDWERHLSDNGFKIVKILLNLSREEQRIRFLRRIDLPDHNWKFSAADAHERTHWDDYQQAFSEMLTATSTEWAPWYVIPADHKWFARICASAVIANALIEIDPHFPKVTPEVHRALQETKRELEAEAPADAAPDPFAHESEASWARTARKPERRRARPTRGRAKRRPSRRPRDEGGTAHEKWGRCATGNVPVAPAARASSEATAPPRVR